MVKSRDDSEDGFWLVVSPGENPKYNAQEYAILYGDRESNRITAYAYDGNNNANSFRGGEYLATYENAFSSSNGMTMFSLDVGAINGAYDTAEWEGVGFGGQQGIWFHQSDDSNFAYNADGTIENYSFGGQMWVDTAFETTHARQCTDHNRGAYYCSPGAAPTQVAGSIPAPGGLALILLGLAGFGLRRKT